MSKEALLGAYFPERRKTIYHQTVDGVTTIEDRQDCEPIVEWVKRRRDAGQTDDVFTHIAEIPLTVLNKAMAEGWLHDEKAWKRWVNDPDNAAFKVYDKRW